MWLYLPSFKQSEEKPIDQRRSKCQIQIGLPGYIDPSVIMRSSHTSLADSPGEYEEGHQGFCGDSNDKVGREWLPCELGDSVD